ncbi:phosphopantothenoylcysteine decarboxylase isoform X2 [Tyto alba]|uniref:phosphopantothenoylcysteine decarboxylase isoform X2 n=1 Tax=Tyto alba TaxID=56313 RepID=UPI001C672B15|nr:phosphopantothenoylcysteine decarboxylase isoform X2 [Tyto alba]
MLKLCSYPSDYYIFFYVYKVAEKPQGPELNGFIPSRAWKKKTSLLLRCSVWVRGEFDWSMEPSSPPEPGFPAEKSSSVPQKKHRVLVGVTGSVAALKLPLLIAELLKITGLEVKVVTTERAKHFYNAQEIPVTLYSDEDEWQLWKGRSDPVLHIELRRWADVMLVAPLDANTLAKLANGICDNLLTCVIRAWDLSKPLLFCPAMNTAMWEHPITAQQVEQLKGFGYTEIPCVVKKLVCGDEGSCT